MFLSDIIIFNSYKCKITRIGNSNFDTNYKMKDNTGIDEKYLVINFTFNLEFDEHIGLTVNKVISHIGLLKRNFIHMDKKQFFLLN
jgi:hypothetical protein